MMDRCGVSLFHPHVGLRQAPSRIAPGLVGRDSEEILGRTAAPIGEARP
jgi:hypothetical protein